MELETVKIEKPEGLNIVLGQTHFIKSAEDIYEAVVNTVPQAKFGVAFCEASSRCLVRVEGNDEQMKDIASRNAMRIGAGHSFIIAMKDAYPITSCGPCARCRRSATSSAPPPTRWMSSWPETGPAGGFWASSTGRSHGESRPRRMWPKEGSF